MTQNNFFTTSHDPHRVTRRIAMLAATDGPLLGVNAWGDEDPEPTDEPEAFIDECDELATPEEVLTKLEKLAADLVLATLRSDPPATPVPAAAISFTVANVRRDGAVLASSDGPLAAHRVPLSATTTLSLRDPNKRRAERYARIWTMLASSHAHLRRNEKVTQRGLYYLMSSGAHTSSLFPDPATVNSALLDSVSLVAVSRRSLGGGRRASGRGGRSDVHPRGRGRALAQPLGRVASNLRRYRGHRSVGVPRRLPLRVGRRETPCSIGCSRRSGCTRACPASWSPRRVSPTSRPERSSSGCNSRTRTCRSSGWSTGTPAAC